MKVLLYVVLGLLSLILVACAGVLVYQHFSDGPTGPLSGGVFTSGEVVPAPIDDWHRLDGDFEFELVGRGTSRTAGGVMLDDEVYISCDLGFIWGRLPESTMRNVLHIIWWFKDWHEYAQQDGRVRIRKDGKIYPVHIERVTDEALLERLKDELEALARANLSIELGPPPQTPPNDILFFKVGAARDHAALTELPGSG